MTSSEPKPKRPPPVMPKPHSLPEYEETWFDRFIYRSLIVMAVAANVFWLVAFLWWIFRR